MRRRPVAAAAAVVVERDRTKHQRHRAGSGHGAGNRQLGKVQTHRVEVFLHEIEAAAEAHIGGGNHRKRPFAPFFQIAEGGLAEKGGFKLLLHQIAAAELRRSQPRHIGQRKHLAGYLPLEILFEKTLFKGGNAVFAVQRIIGRQHRAAGHAVHQVGALEQALAPAADFDLLAVQLLEHAVAEGRRPAAAAGKGQHQQRVVFALAEAAAETVAAAGIDFVYGFQRLVGHQRAGTQQQRRGQAQQSENGAGHGRLLKIR